MQEECFYNRILISALYSARMPQPIFDILFCDTVLSVCIVWAVVVAVYWHSDWLCLDSIRSRAEAIDLPARGENINMQTDCRLTMNSANEWCALWVMDEALWMLYYIIIIIDIHYTYGVWYIMIWKILFDYATCAKYTWKSYLSSLAR